jgi:predicted ATPase/class 3 adenylate cyclase
MNCPHCQTANPAQARFCLGCGQPLVAGHICLNCHTLLPGHARFCFHCGAIVVAAAGQAVASIEQAVARPLPEAAPAPRPVSLDTAPLSAGAPLPATAPRPIQAMLPSLQRYLPHDLYEPLERRPTARDLDAACDHLAALQKTVQTYLPGPVVARPQPPGQPAGGMVRGVFLFGDVSGFTPLSEQLKRLGKQGAELITALINGLFTELVGVLFDHGGDLLKFGGDALLGVFPGETDEELAASALCAVQAGLAMQQVMTRPRFAAIQAAGETRALRIKCGLSAGPYFAAHIGTPQMMAYVTTGHTVNRAEQAEGHAEPGDVVVAEEVQALLGDRVEVGLPHKNPADPFSRVLAAPPLESPVPRATSDDLPQGDTHLQISHLVERLDRLTPYLAADLLPRLVTNPGDVRITPDHRPVTVMFANYVGVSDLIEDLGDSQPEIITGRLNDYFVHMAHIVEHYEGTLGRMDQYAVGDRLVIFFGAPRAHEDDPVRAVHTALDMQAATRAHFAALQTEAGIYRFRQRIGINTGSLFAGNAGAPDLRQEYTLMGDDINMAARLMSMADWGEILVSDKTQERVSAFFNLKDRGALKVKGKEILIPTFQVLTEREQIGRTRGLGPTDAPLVDRDDEFSTLQRCGQQLLNGRGQVVALVGDSGLGKSRLTRELKGWLFNEAPDTRFPDSPIPDTPIWLEGYALSFSERVSYWLAVQVLRGALGLSAETHADDTLFALWERGEELLGKETAREAIPFLAHLMDLPLKGAWAEWVQELDPHVRQKQTFWAAREFFAALARERPLVIALDDLHWADEASLALFEDLLAVTDQAPLMFCLVFRQRHDKGCWRLRDKAASAYRHRYTEVALQPLAEAYSRQLLAELVPGAEFRPEALGEILDKTAGNPFYLEEVVRSLIEDGALVPDEAQAGRWRATARIADIQVPGSLQGAILSRIDRLTEDSRQALQMASVIGRRFQTQVLWGLIRAEAELDTWLAQLERSDLIRPAEVGPEPVYAFPDALVQEVAYESLLVQRRQEFHRRVGETLEEIYAGRLEQECELLAYHFSRSDDRARAVKYLAMAGHKAQAEYANETAVRHYTDLLALLDETDVTWPQRFDLLARRQQVYGLTGQPEAREADLDAMLALAEAHGDEMRRSDALNELADLYQWTGRYDAAIETADRALGLKTGLGDLQGQAQALHQLGVVRYYRGDYAQALPLLQRAVGLRQELGDAKGEAWSSMYLGMIHFFQGDYGQAARFHARALETARARQDWFQEGIHLTNLARVGLRLGEYEAALSQFEKSLEMKSRVGDRTGQGFSRYYVGLAHAYLGRYAEAEAAFRASLDLRREIGDERGAGYSLYGLGLAAQGQGDFGSAADYFEQAHAVYAELGMKAEAILALSYLGQARLGLEDLAGAAEASEQAMALLAEQKSTEEVQQVYFNYYRLLAARGDPAAAEFLEKAHAAMMDQAGRIGDEAQRRAFLEKVKVNREIQAALAG